MTYKERAEGFWKWFEEHETSFRKDIDRHAYEAVNSQLKQKLQEVLPEVVFEISHCHDIYTVELMPMGNSLNRVMMLSLLFFMPKNMKKWEFYNYRIPKHGVMNVHGQNISGEDVLIFPVYDRKQNRFRLKVMCEALQTYPDEEKFSVLYLLLYEHIGEILTESLIEQVEFIRELSYKMRYKHHTQMPLGELRDWLISQLGSEAVRNAEQSGLIYEYFSGKPQPRNPQPRFDIVKGYSAFMDISHEYYEEEKPLLNYLQEQGIQAVFLAADITEPDQAAALQLRIASHLKGHGILLGISEALAGLYMDILLLDGTDVQELCKEEFEQYGMQAHSFL